MTNIFVSSGGGGERKATLNLSNIFVSSGHTVETTALPNDYGDLVTSRTLMMIKIIWKEAFLACNLSPPI